MSNVAVTVSEVYKDFVLPHEKRDSVKSLFTSIFGKSVNTSKSTQHALKGISFEVRKGEFFGIVGRNGSGKSTLLKILAGIYQPTKGSVKTYGKLVPFIELGVGFNPELTGRENVYLNGSILGFTQKEIDANYQDIVDFAELQDFMDQKLKNYSSGMQVRLAFACATRAKADVLLVDEVLAVGDADFQRKCFNYFKKLKREKKTVIFVSHDMSAIREYCDRALLIDESVVLKIGNTEAVATAYTKLFNVSDKEDTVQDKVDRWGKGGVIIGKIKVTPDKINKECRQIKIINRVKVTTELENIVLGFVLKNAQGQGIAGTNTRLLKISTGKVNPDDEIEIEWLVENVLSDGKYTVDVAVVEEDGTVLEWWEGASSFRVYEDTRSPYPIGNIVKGKLKKTHV